MSSNERIRARGISIYRPIVYGNCAFTLTPEEKEKSDVAPDHTHRWTVAVRSAASLPNDVGGADDISHFIKRVTFKLHETYPNPNRNIDKPPFEVTETGWGEFEVMIRIVFVPESGEKPVMFYHHLKLHPWSATAGPPEPGPTQPGGQVVPTGPLGVHAWQYDEVVFNDPFQAFLTTLMNHPPTPLPRIRTRPIPAHTSHAASLDVNVQYPPEFTTTMEREENERIDDARRKVNEEVERLRDLVLEKEKILARLRAEVQ
ncbi:yeats-domain-containing protein [Exidia glandulosa HHB12029]|uniref:Protein AF-9 homolog n=1 Tax=Exidia glandulosa HHB12029 TaxID=1314781 RepID=A0A165QWF7_EXIGL|nr:yeats-domain-containing protein [Exidia glandulosa HHB12029]